MRNLLAFLLRVDLLQLILMISENEQLRLSHGNGLFRLLAFLLSHQCFLPDRELELFAKCEKRRLVRFQRRLRRNQLLAGHDVL